MKYDDLLKSISNSTTYTQLDQIESQIDSTIQNTRDLTKSQIVSLYKKIEERELQLHTSYRSKIVSLNHTLQ